MRMKSISLSVPHRIHYLQNWEKFPFLLEQCSRVFMWTQRREIELIEVQIRGRQRNVQFTAHPALAAWLLEQDEPN